MKWSLRIARVSGIDIRVHLTFVFIVMLFANAFGREHGMRGALFGTLLVCCLFLCVVLHELGHSLVAQAFGVPVREIVLLPIGGVARLGREPAKPLHELLIAIAGPLVNVVIVLGLVSLTLATFGSAWLLEGRMLEALSQPTAGGLLGSLLLGNLMLAIFNMIPALPMDGGRVFRALLSMLIGKPRATPIACTVSQVLAVGLSVLGLMSPGKPDLVLVLIGVFVFLAASQERFASRAAEVLSGLRASDACHPNPVVLSPGDVLGAVLSHMLRTAQPYFAVLHGDQLLGVVSRESALRAAEKLGSEAYVAGVTQRNIAYVAANTPLDQVRARIVAGEGRPLAVMESEKYLGLLSLEDLNRVARLAMRLKKQISVPRAERSSPGAPLA